MTKIQTSQQARKEADIHYTGGWYIAELDDPQLVVQGESAADARQKIAKRWEEYTSELDESDIRIGSSDTPSDHVRRKLTPSKL